jgi:hypothetical protein
MIIHQQLQVRPYKRAIHWDLLICNIVIFSAFLPKLVIAPGINLYLPEIAILISIMFVGFRQFTVFREQRLLFAIFFIIFLFSFWSLIELGDTGSVMRSFKEILYIGIIYWASKIKDKNKVLIKLVKYGALAMIVNLSVFLSGFTGFGSIWGDKESLSSGMSNQGFNILSFKLEHLEGLAHGIWGSYCVLVFVIAASLFYRKLISFKWLFLVCTLFLINTVISVSRESLLVLIVVIILFLIMPQKKIATKIMIIGSLVIGIIGLIAFGESLPIFQKIVYMMDSLSSGGADGNFQLRLNTWTAFLNYLSENIYGILVGFGLSPENFYLNIKPYAKREIVDLPESAIVYVQAYGGLIASIFMFLLIYHCTTMINRNTKYKLVKYFFIGILVTNIISSVSMFSDLLYAHLCLVYGLLILNKNNINEIKSTAYNR